MKITKKLLIEKEACADQVETFAREWPDGVEVYEAACLRAVRLGLDLDWAARRLLSKRARAKYVKAIAQARKEYKKAIAPAEEAYRKAIAPVKAIAPWDEKAATTEYAKAEAPVWAKYQKAVALAFWQAVKLEEGR